MLAQVCTGDVTLSTQAEVDAFDCEEVMGSLTISGDDIIDLAPLSGLTSVGSEASDIPAVLLIQNNASLTSLAGLGNLTSVGNAPPGGLIIQNNDALASLAGLESLTDFDGFVGIVSNAALTSLAGLEGLASVSQSLNISDNAALMSLEGLEALTTLGGLTIEGNAALESLAGLEGLTSISGGTFGSDLVVEDNPSLSDCACGLDGLISGDPPTFTGVDGNVTITANAPGGQCTSPQVVLDAFPDAVCMPVVIEPTPGVPERLSLSTPYPNPFRRTATVEFTVPVASEVLLILYDVLGREVAVLADGSFEASRHEAVFDTTGLPSGTYLVRMTTDGGFAQTQRVTVMR